MSTNFSELKTRIYDWSYEDDDKLVTKIASYCEKYNRNLRELEDNFIKLSQNFEKIDTDYYTSVNIFKNISIKKFVEHIVNADESRPYDLHPPKKEKQILSKEEIDSNLYNKFRSSLSSSLEGISTRPTNNTSATNYEVREHADTMSVVDDDNISVANSRYFSNKNHKGVKIPFIIGTPEFSKNDYLGLMVTEEKKSNQEFHLQKKNTIENAQKLVEDLGFGLNLNNNQQINNHNNHSLFINNSNNNLNNNTNIVNGNINVNNTVPTVPSIPSVHSVPNVSQVPIGIPSVPNVPQVPIGIPSVPNVPQIPIGIPKVPVPNSLIPNNTNISQPIQNVPNQKTEEKQENKQPKPNPSNLMEEIRQAGLKKRQIQENQGANQQNPPITATKQTQPIISNQNKNVNSEVNQTSLKQMPTLGKFVTSSLFEDDDPIFTTKKQDNMNDFQKKPSIFDDKILNKKEEVKLPNVNFADQQKEKEKKKGMDFKGKLSRLFDENTDFEEESNLEKSSSDIHKKLNKILNDEKNAEVKSSKPEQKPEKKIELFPEVKQEIRLESKISGKNLLSNINKDEIKPNTNHKANVIVGSRLKSILHDDEEGSNEVTEKVTKKPVIDPLSSNITSNTNLVEPVLPKKIPIIDPLSNLSKTMKPDESIQKNIFKQNTVEEEQRPPSKLGIDFNQLQNALAGKLSLNSMMQGGNIPENPFVTKDSSVSNKQEQDTAFEEMIVDRSSKLLTKNKKPKKKAFNGLGGNNVVETKVSILSTISENDEKLKGEIKLPPSVTFASKLEEESKIVDKLTDNVTKNKPSSNKKKYFFDDD